MFLENSFVTFGTVLGIFLELIDCLLVFLATFMRTVSFEAPVGVAIPAYPAFTETALVVGRDATATVFEGTRHEKRLDGLFRGGSVGGLGLCIPPKLEPPFFLLQHSDALVFFRRFFFELDNADLFLERHDPGLDGNEALQISQRCLGPGHKRRNLVFLIPRIKKALGKVAPYKVHVPDGVAGHAPGFDGVFKEKSFDTS
jgi:hypothetical protein